MNGELHARFLLLWREWGRQGDIKIRKREGCAGVRTESASTTAFIAVFPLGFIANGVRTTLPWTTVIECVGTVWPAAKVVIH